MNTTVCFKTSGSCVRETGKGGFLIIWTLWTVFQMRKTHTTTYFQQPLFLKQNLEIISELLLPQTSARPSPPAHHNTANWTPVSAIQDKRHSKRRKRPLWRGGQVMETNGNQWKPMKTPISRPGNESQQGFPQISNAPRYPHTVFLMETNVRRDFLNGNQWKPWKIKENLMESRFH